MRLRLRIRRNELPTVSVLWPVGEDGAKQTIAQFLQRVNERVPLEGDSWGLEDYAVSISGFEVFHYDQISTVCKDEDEVDIQPLSYVEVRARTISGRAQITADGRHLVDGVPFGRPLLKRPSRPDVTIPPRKRPRLERDNAEDLEQSDASEIAANVGSGDVDSDEDGDDDFEPPEDSDGDEGGFEDGSESEDEEEDAFDNESNASGEISESDHSIGHTGQGTDDGRGTSKTGQSEAFRRHANGFAKRAPQTQLNVGKRKAYEIGKGDSSSVRSAVSSSDSHDTDDSSDSSSSEDDSSNSSDSEPSEFGTNEAIINHTGSTKVWKSNSTRIEHATADHTPPKMKATTKKLEPSNSRAVQSRNATHAQSPLQANGLPFQGSLTTKSRNKRRREAKQLSILKQQGKLPPHATLDDLRLWSLGKGEMFSGDTKAPAGDRIERSDHVVSKEQSATAAEELEQRRQKLLADLASGGIDVTSENRVTATAEQTSQDAGISTEAADGGEAAAESPAPRKRMRLDVASTARLMFGSLGLRAPKNQEERKALQSKLDASAKRPHITAVPEMDANDQPAEVHDDADAWREKIDLSAVECCDEDVVLSAPPFPFQQRWDPQYRAVKKKKKRNGTLYGEVRANQRGPVNGDFVETYDKYNTNGDGDALNYDDYDEDDVEDADEYWEEGALLDGERGYSTDQDAAALQLVTENAFEEAKEAFPDLPADVSLLPALAECDATEGDFVVFDELACSAATSWQPRMVTRTVRLQEHGDAGWTVRLDPRDLPAKKFDGDGNRVYEKFETMDDDDEDRILAWADMLEPKLLLRGKAVTAEA